MPHKSLLLFLELLAGTLLLWFFSTELLTLSLAPDSFNYLRPQLENGWFLLVNSYSNAVTPWRIGPLFQFILSHSSPLTLYLTLFTVFSIGTSWLLTGHKVRWLQAFLLAITASITTVLLFGWDIVVWSSVVWFPWVYCWLGRMWIKPTLRIFDLIVLLFFVLLLTASANQLSIIILFIAILAAYFHSRPSNSRIVWISLATVFLPATLSLTGLPDISFPDYPTYSRVIVERSLLPRTDALIGQTAPIQIIDWLFLRKSLQLPTIILLFLALLSFLLSFMQKNTGAGAKVAPVLYFILASVLLETSLVSETITQIGPLHSLARIIPGVIFIPLVVIVIAVSLVLMAELFSGWSFTDGLIFLGIGLLLYYFHEKDAKVPYLMATGPEPAWSQMPATMTEQEKKKYDKIILSPSLAVINQHGLEVLKRCDFVRQLNYQPISNFNHHINASHKPRLVRQALTKGSKSRWTRGNGKQVGNEWIHLFFSEPQVIGGLKVSPGSFHSDFPRGIKIDISTDCKADQKDFSEYSSVFLRNPWVGEINFTEKCFPYIESEGTVSIPFKEQVKAQCLLISQIGQTEKYDWSVTKIMIASTKTEQ